MAGSREPEDRRCACCGLPAALITSVNHGPGDARPRVVVLEVVNGAEPFTICVVCRNARRREFSARVLDLGPATPDDATRYRSTAR